MTLGQLTITNSIEMADQQAMAFPTNTMIVILDEEMRPLLRVADSPCVICGSVLLPPYSIMAQEADGAVPPQQTDEAYLHYLHSKESLQLVAGIMAFLVRKIHVIILLNSHESEFGFIPNGIITLFQLRYGVTPFVDIDSRIEYQFAYNPEPMFHDQIIEDLFMFDYMAMDDVMRSWSEHDLSFNVIQKMIWINPPACMSGRFEDYCSTFNYMKNVARANKGAPIPINPFQAGGVT